MENIKKPPLIKYILNCVPSHWKLSIYEEELINSRGDVKMKRYRDPTKTIIGEYYLKFSM